MMVRWCVMKNAHERMRVLEQKKRQEVRLFTLVSILISRKSFFYSAAYRRTASSCLLCTRTYVYSTPLKNLDIKKHSKPSLLFSSIGGRLGRKNIEEGRTEESEWEGLFLPTSHLGLEKQMVSYYVVSVHMDLSSTVSQY
jgi:hypothetical protein